MIPTAQVLILMGSASDAAVMQAAADVLKELGVSAEITVASAHRSPDRVRQLIRDAPSQGVRVFIVGAGAAAHLAGVVAAHTRLPVIGVPIDSSALKGLDALLSTVQMPPAFLLRPFRSDKQGRPMLAFWRPRSSRFPTAHWRSDLMTTRRSSPTTWKRRHESWARGSRQ